MAKQDEHWSWRWLNRAAALWALFGTGLVSGVSLMVASVHDSSWKVLVSLMFLSGITFVPLAIAACVGLVWGLKKRLSNRTLPQVEKQKRESRRTRDYRKLLKDLIKEGEQLRTEENLNAIMAWTIRVDTTMTEIFGQQDVFNVQSPFGIIDPLVSHLKAKVAGLEDLAEPT